MMVLYDKGAIRLKADFRCDYVPNVGDEVKINNIPSDGKEVRLGLERG